MSQPSPFHLLRTPSMSCFSYCVACTQLPVRNNNFPPQSSPSLFMPHVRRAFERRDFVGVSIAPSSSSSEYPEVNSSSAFAAAFADGRFWRFDRLPEEAGESSFYELRTPTILLLLAPPLDDG